MEKSNVVGTIDGSRILYVTRYGYSLVSFRPVRRVRNTNALLCSRLWDMETSREVEEEEEEEEKILPKIY